MVVHSGDPHPPLQFCVEQHLEKGETTREGRNCGTPNVSTEVWMTTFYHVYKDILYEDPVRTGEEGGHLIIYILLMMTRQYIFAHFC
jgi:hypothetical protein